METISVKKEEILQAAVHQFSQKGFYSTSVQDIANDCGISKATIYKFFKSKEDLLVELVKYFNYKIFKTVNTLEFEDNLDSIKKFEKKVYILFKYFFKNKDFMVVITQNVPIINDKEVEAALARNRIFILNCFKSLILETYGDKVLPMIWDLTATFRGMITSFLITLLKNEILISDLRKVSKFIVKSITSIIEFHSKEDVIIPLNTIENMNFNFNFDKTIKSKEDFFKFEWEQEMLKIKTKIEKDHSISDKESLLSSINLIDSEMKSQNRRDFLIDALILYLSDIEILKDNLCYLKTLYIKLKKFRKDD